MPLLFKHRFFPAIRSGAKTQTVRFWRRPMVRPGQLAAVPFLHGRLVIESIEPLAGLADLTDADASAEGLASLTELLADLLAMYPALRSTDASAGARRLFRVRFRFVPR